MKNKLDASDLISLAGMVVLTVGLWQFGMGIALTVLGATMLITGARMAR